jgi:NTP pyrophosphatase (non-canonical NTP hydrolase)
MPFNVLALAGEVGELANLVKKIERGDFGPVLETGLPGEIHEKLSMEVVDVFIYTMQIANILAIDLVKAYEVKREFNATRFGGAKGPKLILPKSAVQPGVRGIVSEPTPDKETTRDNLRVISGDGESGPVPIHPVESPDVEG